MTSVEELRRRRDAWFAAAGTDGDFGSLSNRTVLVSGCNGGLGRAITREVNAGGAFVIGTDLPSNLPGDVTAGVAYIPADLRNPRDVEALLSQVRQVGVDSLVNNAGVMAEKSLAETDEEVWQLTLDVNLSTAYRLTRGLLDTLRAGDEGVIVNVASQLAYTGGDSLTAYSASKAGLLGLTRSLAKELGPAIRVNAVAPGPVVSPMTEVHMSEEWVRRKTANLVAGRMGQPGEVAGVVRFLLSGAASYVHGQTISVNGGGYMA